MADVIDLETHRAAREAQPTEKRRWLGRIKLDRHGDPRAGCRHHYVSIWPASRQVVCRRCRHEVDPFDVLVELSRDWEVATHASWIRDDLNKQIAALRAEEKRIKARIRSAQKAEARRD